MDEGATSHPSPISGYLVHDRGYLVHDVHFTQDIIDDTF